MSATGNPRNKVALKPGHSLMDWIRLGNSGVDMSGTGGAILNVTKEQLVQHNTPSDVWICIRGYVYNISRYLDFHPGGIDELMKGAGIDATNLFNEIHPWVNFESILKKCLVGRLTNGAEEDVFAIPGPSKKNDLDVKNNVKIAIPPTLTNLDWYQQNKYVVIVIYLKEELSKLCISNTSSKELWIWVNEDCLGWNLCHSISWPPSVTVSETKVELKLMKEKCKTWGELSQCRSVEEPALPVQSVMVVKSIRAITHNTFTISLGYRDRLYVHVPIGRHLTLRTTLRGLAIERQYTPICGLTTKLDPDVVTMIVKLYPDGAFSSWLTSRKVGDLINISCVPFGVFSVQSLLKAENIILIAAGTGFTPMLRIIDWALKQSRILDVKLIFFNKTEKDVIWRTELDDLMSSNKRFKVDYVLSDGGPGWRGPHGWITLQFLEKYLPEFATAAPSPYYVCVCGPAAFTQLTERYLQDLGYNSDYYFCFKG